MAVDGLKYHAPDLITPPRHMELVDVSSADADLSYVTKAIAFGVAGAVRVDTVGGETLTLPSGAFASGSWHPMQITKIYTSGTTASDIVVCYDVTR